MAPLPRPFQMTVSECFEGYPKGTQWILMGDMEEALSTERPTLIGEGVSVQVHGLAHFRMKEGPNKWGIGVSGPVPVGTVLREPTTEPLKQSCE